MRSHKARLILDRLARWLVSAGGLVIIACILGILVFLLREVWPLWSASYEPAAPLQSAHDARSVRVDPYQTHVVTLSSDGVCRAVRLSDQAEVARALLVPEGAAIDRLEAAQHADAFTAATEDGVVHALSVTFDAGFADGQRTVTPRLSLLEPIELDPQHRPLRAYSLRVSEGGVFAAAQLTDGTLTTILRKTTYNQFLEQRETTEERSSAPCAQQCKALLLDASGKNLYALTADGKTCWWTIAAGKPESLQVIPHPGSEPTALALLLGERSLVLGCADGSVSQWARVEKGGVGGHQLARIRDFPPLGSAVKALEPATRNRGFFALGDGGRIGAYYATTGALRWSGRCGDATANALCCAPKNDAVYVAGVRTLQRIEVDDPHPEATLGAMFGRVWYEGGKGPEFTYQATAANEEYEPKLSLVPLVFGTLKGTILSLILAVPLAVLGAMYVAHFMHPRLRGLVKPVIELMAALPSVVLGYLAAKWLAPRVEREFCALLLAPFLLPAAIVGAGWLGQRLPLTFRGRFVAGSEVLAFCVVLVAATLACLAIAPSLEALLFAGDVRGWLMRGGGYEQQNGIVVGLAMSFAVTPIVFSISEEAFTNVPRSIVSGSLALGASRWQTVTRVVLPSASPGIFSAIMIGFGRAVGETMIVLMASGGTPILDPSVFTGFRTMSQNLAEQAPEAAHGSTLYRVLFFTGLLLFAFTFVTNTGAELIRQRLRARFS